MNDLNDIIFKIKNNSKEENKKLAEELKAGLDESQSNAFQQLLSNKDLMAKLLSSEEAKQIINKLGGEKNGHQ